MAGPGDVFSDGSRRVLGCASSLATALPGEEGRSVATAPAAWPRRREHAAPNLPATLCTTPMTGKAVDTPPFTVLSATATAPPKEMLLPCLQPLKLSQPQFAQTYNKEDSCFPCIQQVVLASGLLVYFCQALSEVQGGLSLPGIPQSVCVVNEHV